MLDVNALPNQTDDDRAIILHAMNGIIWSVITRGTETLDADDMDDLHSRAIEAANRAIVDYRPGLGATLATLVVRYVTQARRDFMRRRMAKRRAPDRAVCFSDVAGVDSLPSGECPIDSEAEWEKAHHAAMIQDMEIIIDRARNDGVLSAQEHRFLVARRLGGTLRSIGIDECYSPAGVKLIIDAAVAKIRLAYRTAE